MCIFTQMWPTVSWKLTLGFVDCVSITREQGEGAGQTTPEQTGHYFHYDTKLANSRYFHGNSCRIPLTELLSQPSCSWKSREYCHPFCIEINAIAWILLNGGINWPAGFDVFASNCSIHVLVCVWSQMNCCKWLQLSLEFNFTVWHTSEHSKPC